MDHDKHGNAQLLAFTCSESSKQLNEQRLKLLAAKQTLMRSVFEEAKSALKKQASGPGYGDMLATLLVQVCHLSPNMYCLGTSVLEQLGGADMSVPQPITRACICCLRA